MLCKVVPGRDYVKSRAKLFYITHARGSKTVEFRLGLCRQTIKVALKALEGIDEVSPKKLINLETAVERPP